MKVRVRLFAGLRERAGWSERELEGVERVGAVAGLFLLLVLLSGIVDAADSGNEWATQATLAFGRLLQPFLLKTVGRVAGSEEKPQQPAS